MKTRTTLPLGLLALSAMVIGLPGITFMEPTIGRAQNTPPTQNDKPFDQAAALDSLRKAIAGKEDKPAEEVFKNIQILKGVPAGRLLRVMEMGYARSLGVNCTHCHVPEGWEKEDKPTKQIARDMFAMMAVINNEQLKKIKNLKGPNSIVNCTTCHRGQVKPALNLPETKG
jgi:photosynthetic reaction center cytochrome c subunit